jgi:endonuclease YncB( thermonuclease family)
MEGKSLKIVPVSKDQYGRILAIVCVKSHPFDSGLNVSIDLLERGLATVYKGQGSDYDGMKGAFIAAEKKAKESKVGIWSLEHFETPGQYKRRQKEEGASSNSGRR